MRGWCSLFMAMSLWCFALMSSALTEQAKRDEHSQGKQGALAPQSTLMFFVAVNGTSSADGRTPQTAFKTVEEARDAIRTARGTSGPRIPAEIRVRRSHNSNSNSLPTLPPRAHAHSSTYLAMPTRSCTHSTSHCFADSWPRDV